MNPISLTYITTYKLERDPTYVKRNSGDPEKFGVSLLSDTSFSKIKMKISL